MFSFSSLSVSNPSIIEHMQPYQLNENIFSLKNGNDTLYVDFITPHIVRLTHDISHLSRVVQAQRTDTRWSIKEESDGYSLITDFYCLKVYFNLQIAVTKFDGKPIIVENDYELDHLKPILDKSLLKKEGHAATAGLSLAFVHSFELEENDGFYGLGDHVGPLNKKGYEFINYNTDYPQAHEEDVKSLYKSINFFLCKRENGFFGLYLDSTYKSLFNFGTDQKRFYFGSVGGADDFYLFLGEDAGMIIKDFTSLTGRAKLPPRWTLGYQQSRWSYMNEEEVKEVVSSFKKNDIPLEAIHLDIDYMDGYRVFTHSSSKFPNLQAMVASLYSQGIKVVTILDPGIKVDPDYDVYKEAISGGYVATLNGKTYENEVWPGLSVYPSFNEQKTRKWWSGLVCEWMKLGIAGIWCDMNEPASFKGPLPDDVCFGGSKHDEIHNVYGHYMAMATYEGIKAATKKRPFVITRACFAGTNAYSTVWTGDNQSIYSSLYWLASQQMSLALSGVAFFGSDIGGFGGDCPSELMNRWVEMGVFSPFMRNHSCLDSRHQEPYAYDKNTISNYRKWVYFRYRIVPYIYDALYKNSIDGSPVVAPLWYYYPEEKGLDNLNDELMWGENILVAPILTPGSLSRSFVLPFGKWYSFFTMEMKMGGLHCEEVPLGETLIYAKEGAIVPMYPSLTKNLDKEPKELVLRLFPGKGKYVHYQDNGTDFAYEKGEYNLYEFTNNDGELSIKMLHEGYPKYKRIRAISPHSETLINLK
jgi:alpha-glucosidase